MSDYRQVLQENALPQKFDYNALVHFARTVIPPAPALYMTVDDVLQARVFSPSTSVTVNASWRIQTPDGQVIPGFRSFVAVTVGAASLVQVLEKVEGFLLSVSIETPGAPRGQVFVQVEVNRGQGSGDLTGGHVLVGGYPGSAEKIGFPQTPVHSPLHGPGWMMDFRQNPPAAGVDWIITVPAGEQWGLTSLQVQLTTAVAVANRAPTFQITDAGGNAVCRVSVPAFQVAALTVNYSLYPGAQLVNFNNDVTLPLPNNSRLPSGWSIGVITTALQAADQWSTQNLMVERFITA